MREFLCDVAIAFSVTYFGHAPWWAGVIMFLILRDMSWSHEAAKLSAAIVGLFAEASPMEAADAHAVTPESVARINSLDRERIVEEVRSELLKQGRRQHRGGRGTRGDVA